MTTKRHRYASGLVLACAIATSCGLSATSQAATSDYPAVTQQRLLHAESDSGWLMYRRAYNSNAYAPFKQITPENVKDLKTAFTYKTGLKQGHEGAPIVNGHYMFITTPLDHLVALDSTSGPRAANWPRSPPTSP